MADQFQREPSRVLRHTSTIWPCFAKSSILLTGGTGFVGRWLIRTFFQANKLLNLRSRLFVLARNPPPFDETMTSGAVELLIGDLKVFRPPKRRFDYVIHASMEHKAPNQSTNEILAANREGTSRVLDMAHAHETRRLLYISSGAVYGEQPSDLANISENFVPGPQTFNPYAQSKRESEALCVKAGSANLIAVIGRLFSFVGPYLPLDQNFAVGNFVRDAITGGPIQIEGDGTPLRSYLHGEDLAIWLWTLLAHGNSAGPYNVGSDQEVSILELAQIVEAVCGVTRGISVACAPMQGKKPPRYVPSIEKARRQLGLTPWTSLREGIRDMFEWARYAG